MLVHTSRRLNDLHDELTLAMLGSDPLVRAGGGAQLYGIVAQADSMVYDYDLADSWVSKQRWNMLTKQYLNGPAIDEWLGLIGSKMKQPKAHGIAFLRSQIVKPRGTKRISRQWGSCMIGWSFRRYPVPHLAMHSRSTYLGFLAPLDIGVAQYLATLAGEVVNVAPEEIRFTWFLEQATFHQFRSLPWWFKDSPIPDYARRQFKESLGVQCGMRAIRRLDKMDQEGRLYGDMAYAQEMRYRMKYHSQVHPERIKPLLGKGEFHTVTKNPKVPSVMLSTLPVIENE